MGGLTGGSGKSGISGIGGGGFSPEDIGFIQQALGMGTQMLHSTYQQLGLGVPDPNVFGGDPATAAKAGGSLQYGSPGTGEQSDVSGLGNMANAALGQIQVNNQSNPAISGTVANQIANNNQLAQLAGQAQFNAGASAAGGGVANVGNVTS